MIRSYKIILISLILLLSAVSADASNAKKHYQLTVDMASRSQLILVTKFASVDIRTWDNNYASFEAEVTITARTMHDAEQYLERVDFISQNSEDHALLTTVLPDLRVEKKQSGFLSTLFGASSQYAIDISITLFMPRQTDISVTTTLSPITMTNVNGIIKAETTDQPIKLIDIKGSVTAYTTNAAVIAEMMELGTEEIELSTSNADIILLLPADAKITLQAEAYEGEVTSDFKINSNGVFTDPIKNGWINGGGVRSNLYTVNGNISIGILK